MAFFVVVRGKVLFLAIIFLLVALCVWGLSVAADTVEIGSKGGTVAVESDLEILFNNGGGHVTWRISGEAAPEMRRIIDKNYGNNDGTLTPAEAQQYTSALDNYLTLSGAVYHGGKLQSFSLLDRNRGVEDNTNFLVGTVNDSRAIEIRFLIEATLSTTSTEYMLNDDIMVRSLFESLRTSYDTNTYVYVGKVDIVHMNYIVGMNSYSDFSTDHGRVIRFRGPIWEIYRYTVSFDGGSMGKKKDLAKFDTFNVLESPLELFILLAALGYFMLYIPKRQAKTARKQKVKSLHRGALGLAVLTFVIYFFGVDGLAIWVLGPLFFVLVFVLSYKIYIQGWKGIAKPLSLHESKELDREEGIVRPESYRKIQAQKYYSDEGDQGGDYEEPEPERPPPRRPRNDPSIQRAPPPNRGGQTNPEIEDEGGPIEEEQTDQRPTEPPISVKSPRATVASPRVATQRPAQAPKVEAPPPGPPVETKKIRCVQCKEIFVAEIKARPQKVVCPVCGKVGMIK